MSNWQTKDEEIVALRQERDKLQEKLAYANELLNSIRMVAAIERDVPHTEKLANVFGILRQQDRDVANCVPQDYPYPGELAMFVRFLRSAGIDHEIHSKAPYVDREDGEGWYLRLFTDIEYTQITFTFSIWGNFDRAHFITQKGGHCERHRPLDHPPEGGWSS